MTIEGGNNNGNGPDLLPANLNIGQGAPGQVLGFTFTLINQGNATANGSYIINSYISSDGVLSSDDIQEGSIPTGNTGVGSTLVNGAITVPNLPSGTYFFFLVVDDGNNISETNEVNNTIVGSLVITNNNFRENGTQNNQPTNGLNTGIFGLNKLFPNPTSGNVFSQIEASFDGEVSVQVTNVLGQVLLKKMVPVHSGINNFQLELDEFESGIYNVIYHNSHKVVTKQIVVATE